MTDEDGLPARATAVGTPPVVGPRTPRDPTEDPELTAGFDRQGAIERAEDTRTLLRTRRILVLGLLMIPVYLLTDWAIMGFIEPGPIWLPMLLRSPALLSMSIVLLWLRRTPPPTGQRIMEVERLSTAVIAVACNACAIAAGGLASVYGLNISIILVGRSAMRYDRWHDALPSIAFVSLSHPVMLLGATLFSPRIAAQLGDPPLLAQFLLFVTINVIVASLTLLGGDTTWRLRRQLIQDHQIGRYRLQRLLGTGGMGEVWAAYFPPLKRDVALKILRADQRPRPVSVARFEREVRATAELTHPNTVRVLDFGVTEDGLWFYAMELLDGEALDELVKREGPLPPARAAHLVLQATRALTEAHQRGIIHRDIKPQNLFVTTMGGERDFIKLLDFGIALVTRSDSGQLLTRTGVVTGTPAYLSPELAGGGRADARSDIYGLGAVLYQSLTGQPPFVDSDLTGLLASILVDRVRPPSEVRGEPIPPELEEIVLRCLAREPAARYQSAQELAAALDSWTREHRWDARS